MAKFRKQKKNSSKLARPGSDHADEALKNDKVLPILAKLKSADFKDRVVAIGALNSMVDDPKLRSILLREKLLQIILSHSLSDSSQEIVAESLGLIRNIIIEEGRDPAVYLFRQNIFATLKSSIEKLGKVWVESGGLEKLSDTDRSVAKEAIENLVGICSGMVLCDDDIFDAFVAQLFSQIFSYLVGFAQSKYSLIVDATCELFYIMSEDTEAARIMVGNGFLMLVNAVEGKTVTCQVYKLGINYNLIEVVRGGSEQDLMHIADSLYDTVRGFDLATTVPSAPEITAEPKQLKNAVIEAARVRAEINATQVAFEIFASIMESSASFVRGGFTQEFVDCVNKRIAPLAIKALQYPNYALRACSTLNNIGWTFNLLEIDWTELAQSIWVTLPPLLESTDDPTTLASVIGLIASISDCLEGRVPLAPEDISKLLLKCTALKPSEINLAFDETREYMLLVKALIPFLCSVGRLPENIEICKIAAATIFESLSDPSQVSPELIVECINGIFELFGDNDTPSNAIYIENNLNEKLKLLRPEIKRVLKSVNKKHQELREQGDEALTNLDRFITYKSGSQPL